MSYQGQVLGNLDGLAASPPTPAATGKPDARPPSMCGQKNFREFACNRILNWYIVGYSARRRFLPRLLWA